MSFRTQIIYATKMVGKKSNWVIKLCKRQQVCAKLETLLPSQMMTLSACSGKRDGKVIGEMQSESWELRKQEEGFHYMRTL